MTTYTRIGEVSRTNNEFKPGDAILQDAIGLSLRQDGGYDFVPDLYLKGRNISVVGIVVDFYRAPKLGWYVVSTLDANSNRINIYIYSMTTGELLYTPNIPAGTTVGAFYSIEIRASALGYPAGNPITGSYVLLVGGYRSKMSYINSDGSARAISFQTGTSTYANIDIVEDFTLYNSRLAVMVSQLSTGEYLQKIWFSKFGEAFNMNDSLTGSDSPFIIQPYQLTTKQLWTLNGTQNNVAITGEAGFYILRNADDTMPLNYETPYLADISDTETLWHKAFLLGSSFIWATDEGLKTRMYIPAANMQLNINDLTSQHLPSVAPIVNKVTDWTTNIGNSKLFIHSEDRVLAYSPLTKLGQYTMFNPRTTYFRDNDEVQCVRLMRGGKYGMLALINLEMVIIDSES